MTDDDGGDRCDDDSPTGPIAPERRALARARGVRASDVLVRVFEIEVELILPGGAIHAGVVMLARDEDGYRTLGEAPEHWIDRVLLATMLELDQRGFDRACMAIWLAALDAVP